MKIGVFHPHLNRCGGGEWVALNIINVLRQNGHQVIVLTDEKIDQNKFVRAFGQKLQIDGELIYSFQLFKMDLYNIYTNILGCLILKSKCDLILDTFSCTILPSVDFVYMHFPRFMKSNVNTNKIDKLKDALFFFPYRLYEKKLRKNMKQVIFANSEFTTDAIRNHLHLPSHLLHPPVSSFFLQNEQGLSGHQKLDQVVTVSRFAPEKNLEMIPHLAKKFDNLKFFIIGNLHYAKVYSNLSKLVHDLNVQDRVILMTDVPKTTLRKILLESKVYLHCAVNEHFGVSIIDAMACGCVPITHDSGGPQFFVPKTLRYKNCCEAAERIENAIANWSPKTAQELFKISSNFRQEVFAERFLRFFNCFEMSHCPEPKKY